MPGPEEDALTIHFDPDARYAVEELDEPFARVGELELLARVYRPLDAPDRPRVGLVDVHGGAWAHFDRTLGATHGRALAASGAVVVALDFRQAPAHRYPTPCLDVGAGLHWTRAHAARLGVDPACIGLIGSSSGGQIALEVALRSQVSAPDGRWIRLPDGSWGAAPERPPEVAFVLALFPVSDPLARYRYVLGRRHEGAQVEVGFFPEPLVAAHLAYFEDEKAMESASIPRILRAGEAKSLPPVWVAQPELDQNVPMALTEDLVRAYREAGGRIECEVFAGQLHGFVHRAGTASDHCIERMRAFVAEQARRS